VIEISVVTVCFNSAATIRHAVESFLAQDHADKEMLLIDGGSTDETLEIVRSYGSDRIVVRSGPDKGIYDAMNKGLAAYSGDAVGFLNSDDRFADSGALSAIAGALDGADMVYGDLDFVLDHVSRHVVRKWRSTPFRRGAFRSGWMPPHPTFYMRRQVADSVGLFDLRYRIAADYDYMLQAFELHPHSAVRIDRVLIEMQHGGSSTSGIGAYLRSNLEAHRSRRQRLGVGPLDRAFLAKPLRKLPQLLVQRQ
jgi:glycosyltransferase involved in cell wall biosynthesis